MACADMANCLAAVIVPKAAVTALANDCTADCAHAKRRLP